MHIRRVCYRIRHPSLGLAWLNVNSQRLKHPKGNIVRPSDIAIIMSFSCLLSQQSLVSWLSKSGPSVFFLHMTEVTRVGYGTMELWNVCRGH